MKYLLLFLLISTSYAEDRKDYTEDEQELINKDHFNDIIKNMKDDLKNQETPVYILECQNDSGEYEPAASTEDRKTADNLMQKTTDLDCYAVQGN